MDSFYSLQTALLPQHGAMQGTNNQRNFSGGQDASETCHNLTYPVSFPRGAHVSCLHDQPHLAILNIPGARGKQHPGGRLPWIWQEPVPRLSAPLCTTRGQHHPTEHTASSAAALLIGFACGRPGSSLQPSHPHWPSLGTCCSVEFADASCLLHPRLRGILSQDGSGRMEPSLPLPPAHLALWCSG